ncbi:MAG: class I SAM-dependent methyltransferase [Lachnospiraceae bacterium]|nr:class I SAM-dependent methyltransferase [Lachnospiraceae bacterium]
MMKRIIVWGTGMYFEELCERGCIEGFEILAFCDNDSKKHGQLFHEKEIIAPDEIKERYFDAIYIASLTYYEEIKMQILREKLAPESKIKSFIPIKDKYEGELAFWSAVFKKEGNHFSNTLYKKRMLEVAGEEDDSFWTDKVVVDFGCGPRGSLAWTKTPAVKIGVDVLAARYLEKFGDELVRQDMVYVTCSEDRIPIPDNYADWLITINSLDHVDNLDKMASELIRILKPGGSILGSFNLNEPVTECEPQTLTEEILEEKLLSHFDIVSRRIVKMEDIRKEMLYVRAVKG